MKAVVMFITHKFTVLWAMCCHQWFTGTIPRNWELYLAQLETHQWWIQLPHGILLLQVLVQLTQLVLDHLKPLTLHQQYQEVENEEEGSRHTEGIPGARLRCVESTADALVILTLAQQQWAQSFQKDHDILQLAGLLTGKQRIN